MDQDQTIALAAPTTQNSLQEWARALLFGGPITAWKESGDYYSLDLGTVPSDVQEQAIGRVLLENGVRDGLANFDNTHLRIHKRTFEHRIKPHYGALHVVARLTPMDTIYFNQAAPLLFREGKAGWQLTENGENYQRMLTCDSVAENPAEQMADQHVIPAAMELAVHRKLRTLGVKGASTDYQSETMTVLMPRQEFEEKLAPKLGEHDIGTLTVDSATYRRR